MDKEDKIYIAGHKGMVGSAIFRCLEKSGYINLVLRSSKELDLRCQEDVKRFFEAERPTYVFLVAAKVGGIQENIDHPVELLLDNLRIQNNVIEAAYMFGVQKLMFLGSSCIYPRLAAQPISEDLLLTGALEPTNEAYALAKICGLRLCQYYKRQYGADFISAMPCNLYGRNDNYDLQKAHVMPALIRRFYEAKKTGTEQLVLWGSGMALREFLYVDDLADACVFLMENYSENETINIGAGKDITIHELALLVQKVVGFEGEIIFDPTKPDGMPRKLLDVSKLAKLGWHYTTELEDGIKLSYQDFLAGHYRAER